MTRTCDTCRQSFDPAGKWQRLCWPCWHERKDREERASEYDCGYRKGFADGLADAQRDRPALDRDLNSRAVHLCHPDRHPPERAVEANAITAALLELRQGAAA